jgi:hypothetical protein
MDSLAVADLFQSAAAAAAAARLIQLRLAGRFPALLNYLLYVALLNGVLGAQNHSTILYFYSYVILEPFKCAVGILAVRELFALIFDNYPGIRTAGRWGMYAGLTVAISISLLTTVWTGGARGRSKLFYFEVTQRWIVFILALVICAILWSLSRYPLHLGRNTMVSSAFFSAVFLADACRLFLDSLTQYLYNLNVDRPESYFEGLCFLTWAALLRHAEDPMPERIKFSSPAEEHLLQQLAALNQLVTRASRQ